MAEKKYICENGHEFNTSKRVEDSTDVCYCCPVEGCTAGENFRASSDANWLAYVNKLSKNRKRLH